MKKVLCAVLAVLMLVSFAACGKDANPKGLDVPASALVLGQKLWSFTSDAAMDNATVKMQMNTVEALKTLAVKKPDGTQATVTPAQGQVVVCITATVDKILAKGCDIEHMGGKITADNMIYYLKRMVVPKKDGAVNVIFYACVPERVNPENCSTFKASVSLHPNSFEDDDDQGLNRELPLRNMDYTVPKPGEE